MIELKKETIMKSKIVSHFLIAFVLVAVPFVALSQTLSSPNYSVEDSTFDAGGEPSSSTNYRSTDSIGNQGDGVSSSTNYKTFPGFAWQAFPGVPAQPTLTNTGGTLYTSLDFIIATGGNQTDTNYAIAISPDNFTTTYYIQTDDTLGTTEAWQDYSGWGSGSGERVTGLVSGTTYKIKVKARYGADSESGFSVTASATTSDPSLTITFAGVASSTSVAGETTTVTSTTNAIPYGSLILGTPAVAAHSVTVSTNAISGYTTTLQQDGDLRTGNGQQITAVSGTNASPAAWPGSITDGRFGYHSTDSLLCTGTTSRFSTNNTYAAATTTPEEVACSTGPVTTEQTTFVYKLEVNSLQAAGNYQNVLTYITTAKF
jgi:hypothetical protein